MVSGPSHVEGYAGEIKATGEKWNQKMRSLVWLKGAPSLCFAQWRSLGCCHLGESSDESAGEQCCVSVVCEPASITWGLARHADSSFPSQTC